MEIVKLENICKKYYLDEIEIEVLKNINLSINQGEFVAIMGPSGSGKTTLMSILGCLDSPTSGNYYLENQNVSHLTDNELAKIRNKKIGFVFQTFNLLSKSNALENVKLPLIYGRVKNKNELAEQALNIVGLSDRKKHKPAELSGGQRQRVAIARAIVTTPSIIMADEPTGNLDSKTGLEIMNIFCELHKKGVTIILVTHEQDIAKYAKRKIYLKDGLIISDERVN
ncbi:MAG TPA: ABC transporter ATP-binding protein [bacterium]|nr:ABC transporter ATP-binding protein [bacterium]